MSIISIPVSLPKIAINKLWESEGFGEPHPILGIAGIWLNDEGKRGLEEFVFTELARHGLADGRVVAPELRDTLRLIAHATEEYYAWVSNVTAGESGAILLAAREGEAVRVVRGDDDVVLQPIEADRLAEQFAESLLAAEPAQIRPLRVPKSEYSQDPPPEPEDDEFDLAWRTEHPHQKPADTLRELMRGKRAVMQQIYAARRGDGGRRLRVGPYTAIDIVDQGRVLTYLEDQGAEQHIACLPGSQSTLTKVLTAANAALV